MADRRRQVDVVRFKASYQQELDDRRQIAARSNRTAFTGNLCKKMVCHRAGISNTFVSTRGDLVGQLVAEVLKRTVRILGLSEGLR